jgi:hypothetical protein
MELALRDPNWIGIFRLWGVNWRLLKAPARLSSFAFPNSSEKKGDPAQRKPLTRGCRLLTLKDLLSNTFKKGCIA